MTTTRRFDDWPERLAEYLEARQALPFSWGEMDCAMFAAGAIIVMTGIDPAAEFRGRYDSHLSAAQMLIGDGFTDVEDAAWRMAAQAGFEEIAVLMAQRGDLVLLDGSEGLTLGLVGLDGQAASPGPQGLECVPLEACRRAWRVA